MFTRFTYNQPQTIRQNRLIFFALPNEGGKSTVKRVKTTDELTEERRRKISQLGLDESQFKGPARLDARIIDKLHKNETLRDGTYTKDPRNPHFLLMEAVKAGKFPKRGEKIPRFLEAIEGGEHEKKEALKVLKELYLHEGPLAEKNQAPLLERLDAARAEDAVESARKSAEETTIKIETATQTAETEGKVAALTEGVEVPEDKTLKIGNWEVMPPREALMGELKEVAERYRKTDARYRKAYEECEKTAAELRKPGLDAAKKETLTTRLHNLEQEKIIIEREMESIKREAKELREEYDTWIVKTMKMFKKLETFLAESGIDLREAKTLNRWLFDQLSLDNPKSSSLELGGTVTSPETGISTKEYGKITVTKVNFDHLDLPPGKENDEQLRNAIGQLMIEFKDEKGITITKSYVNFLKMINGEEVYEEMNLAECNRRIEEETFHKNLEAGDKFKARVVKGFTDDGEEVYGDEEFAIEKIEDREGETMIVLDRHVTKTEKEKMSPSTHPALYFDRKQKEFSPGEFAKYVKQHNFKRVPTSQDDDQEIVAGAERANEETLKKYGLPAEERARLILPKRDGEEVRVTVYSDTGEPQEAFIKNSDGGTYNIRILVPRAKSWEEREEEKFFARKGVKPKTQEGDYEIRQIRLSPAALAEMANKGDIAKAHEDEHGAAHDAEHGEPSHGEREPSHGEIPHAEPHGEHPLPQAHAPHAGTEEEEADEHDVHATPHKHKKHEEEEPPKGGELVKAEALRYDQIYKVGGMKLVERGFLRRLWDDTRTLSLSDIWEMGKAGYDYYLRRWDRRQKDKYSSVGENLPYFSSEMRRIKQAAENEEVHQFHESFSQKGVFEIEERLRVTRNLDEMKACFADLAEKGHMRWDDIEMWKNLNRFIKDPSKLIPIPTNGDPYTRISKHDDRTGLDFLQPAIDSLWGEGQYDHWSSQDKSTRQSGARKYYEKGKELEIIEGGHEKALEKLLRRHKNGEFVDPQEYEGLILHMIDAGKSNMPCKLYYIVAGVTAENHHGHTILSFDRAGHINSEMLAQFPILEYLTTDPPREGGPEGKPKKHRWTKDDYKMWLEYFDQGDHTNCRPTQATYNFLWRYIIPSYENETRCNKDLRNADKLDHDDMFAYLPPASTAILTSATRSVGGAGSGKYLLTSEGYSNAVPGFSEYIKSLAQYKNMNRLPQAIKSFVRFESILMDRWKTGDDAFYRMDKNTLNRKTVVTDTPPIVFFKELDMVLKKIGEAYADTNPELKEALELQQMDTRGWDMQDRETRARQRRLQNILERFDDIFDAAIKTDNGEKLMAAINGSQLTGMPFSAVQKRKAEIESEGSEFDKSGGGGHGHGHGH